MNAKQQRHDPIVEPQATRIQRRNFLRLIGGSAAFQAMSQADGADKYPARPVRIFVGFPPGGTSDIVARVVGQSLAERLGQPFVIENRAGASGNIAAEVVAKTAADGYTLLLVASSLAINVSFYGKASFDFLNDIVPVSGIINNPLVMVVNPAFPAESVRDFIAYAKANPGKLNMASPGNGTSPHVAGELFRMMTGIDMVHVPYRGGSIAPVEVIAGRADVLFGTMPSVIEQIRAGKLRALAVSTEKRSFALPDVPTIAETVTGYEASDWYGMGAPKGTPPQIVQKLNEEITQVIAQPSVQGRFVAMGAEAMPSSPADFRRLIAAESVKWERVVKFAGLKSD